MSDDRRECSLGLFIHISYGTVLDESNDHPNCVDPVTVELRLPSTDFRNRFGEFTKYRRRSTTLGCVSRNMLYSGVSTTTFPPPGAIAMRSTIVISEGGGQHRLALLGDFSDREAMSQCT